MGSKVTTEAKVTNVAEFAAAMGGKLTAERRSAIDQLAKPKEVLVTLFHVVAGAMGLGRIDARRELNALTGAFHLKPGANSPTNANKYISEICKASKDGSLANKVRDSYAQVGKWGFAYGESDSTSKANQAVTASSLLATEGKVIYHLIGKSKRLKDCLPAKVPNWEAVCKLVEHNVKRVQPRKG